MRVDVGITRRRSCLATHEHPSAGSVLASTNKAQGQSSQQPIISLPRTRRVSQPRTAQAQGGQPGSKPTSGGASARPGQAFKLQPRAAAGSGSTGIHSAGPTTAGAEQANANNAANANANTQQSQQSQQAQQTQQMARPQQSMQSSVAEQVSVKIPRRCRPVRTVLLSASTQLSWARQ